MRNETREAEVDPWPAKRIPCLFSLIATRMLRHGLINFSLRRLQIFYESPSDDNAASQYAKHLFYLPLLAVKTISAAPSLYAKPGPVHIVAIVPVYT